MKIGVQTWGSHGDIRPFLALAEALQSSGHDVSLAITGIDGKYDSSASRGGVKIQSIASPVVAERDELARIEAAIFHEANPIRQVDKILRGLFEPAEQAMYRAAERLCADSDIVIGHFFHYPLQTAAEKAGRPYVSVTLVHSAIPTGHKPPNGFPGLGKWGNLFSWWLVRTVLNKNIKKFPDALRARQGLGPAGDLVNDVWCSHRLNLIAVSPQICQRQEDWSDVHQVCGFFDMPPLSQEGEVSEELDAFLASGEPPVYMTLGSAMPTETAAQEETVRLLTRAAALANCRAIIQAPLWRECGFVSSGAVHYVRASPHNTVFPRCAAIVHHGGAGTTQAATRAGVPSVVVAHIAEQEFWGSELKRLGVSTGVLRRGKLTSRRLASGLERVLRSRQMREKARAIGVAMKNEDGVRRAVELINERFKN